MLGPMITLTVGIAVLDELTRLARLEIDGAPLVAALSAAACHLTTRRSNKTKKSKAPNVPQNLNLFSI
jgi:hypothetical protein